MLLKMLPHYYAHVCKYENTLITKFFGLHRIKLAGGHKVYVDIDILNFLFALNIGRFPLKILNVHQG